MRLSFFISLALFFTACKKEAAPTAPATDPVTANASILKAGLFQNGPYGTVMGKAEIWKDTTGKYEVVLDSFSTNNGPDLYVYLSKEKMPVNFIVVGKLKSISGRQSYALSDAPDLSQYTYVCIHCKAFNHLFGWAPLP